MTMTNVAWWLVSMVYGSVVALKVAKKLEKVRKVRVQIQN